MKNNEAKQYLGELELSENYSFNDRDVYFKAIECGIKALEDVEIMQKEAKTIAEDAYAKGKDDGCKEEWKPHGVCKDCRFFRPELRYESQINRYLHENFGVCEYKRVADGGQQVNIKCDGYWYCADFDQK